MTRPEAKFGPHRASTTAGDDGKWRIDLPPVEVQQIGKSYELTVAGKNTIRRKNVLMGEVWICAGQSNMEMPLGTIGTAWSDQGGVENSELEVAGARYPEIRLFTVWKNAPVIPADDCLGKWAECSPETAFSFPAPAYFFGRRIHNELNIPVGIIHNAYSGVAVEAYLRPSILEQITGYTPPDPGYVNIAVRHTPSNPGYEPQVKEWPQQHKTYKRKLAEWEKMLAADAEHGGHLAWAEPEYNDANWKTFSVPQVQDAPEPVQLKGNVWLRKEIDIPIYWGARDVAVHLPAIDGMDLVCFNGTPVSLASSDAAGNVYRVPAAVVKPWRNVIALRILNANGNNPFDVDAGKMKVLLPVGPSADPVLLAGQWRYRTGLDLEAKPARPEPAPVYYPPPDSTVYNGMVAPLIPFSIRGVIFYQGESNIDRADQYRKLFSAMIQDWRNQWGQGDFPF